MILTLALLFLLIWLVDLARQTAGWGKIKYILPMLPVVLVTLYGEGGFYMLPLAIIFYFFYGQKNKQALGALLVCLVYLVYDLYQYAHMEHLESLYSYLCFSNEWAMLLVIACIYLYSGKRGRNDAFAKYLFYVLYPLHLWILMVLR